MGGDSCCSSLPSTEDVPLCSQHFPHEFDDTSVSSDDEECCLSHKLENDSVMKGADVSDSGEFPDVGCCKASIDKAIENRRLKVYREVLRNYEDLHPRIHQLEEAKNKILSYTPGSLADKAACNDIREYDVPIATSLLLIGPKGSGKSSLVNKISRVFEDDMFLPARAQVSCSSSPGVGTYFLHEYMVPRNSGSFCLYDTRGLSVNSSENQKMIMRWMTKGVRHGEMIRRNSDSITLDAQLNYKARRSFCSRQVRGVDFVIFVVNGLSVLESLNSTDETEKGYSQMIATNFNNPLLSFKDDKPAIVVTHGDLLSLSDRVRVRAYLGEQLGVPPTLSIFDIPDDNDPVTTLAIFDMIIFCLDRADRNLPPKDRSPYKVHGITNLLFWMAAAIVIVAAVVFGISSLHRSQSRAPQVETPDLHQTQPPAPPAPSVETPDSGSQPRAPSAPSVETADLGSQPQAPPAPWLKKPREKKPVLHRYQPQAPTAQPLEVDWHKIRHLWLG